MSKYDPLLSGSVIANRARVKSSDVKLLIDLGVFFDDATAESTFLRVIGVDDVL